jgi:phage tail-like protein
MAGEKQEAPWPVPKFHFKATFGSRGEMAFQEVSGLDTEYDVVEYRAGDNPDYSRVKLPGLRRGSDVTLKKGMFKSDSALFDYFNVFSGDSIIRERVTIQLLDEEHNPMFTWTLSNAFPLKVSGTDMNAQKSEIAVQEIVLAYEGLTLEAA